MSGQFVLPDPATVVTESDVEQKLAFPLLTAPAPYGLGYSVAELPTKANIRRFKIGKGKDETKLYFPDYLAVLGGLPNIVVEVKAPGIALDEAYREARLYADELNAAFPSKVNPVSVVIALNAEELWAGPVDQAEPALRGQLANLVLYSPLLDELVRLAGREVTLARNKQLLAKIRPNVFKKPRRMLGGMAVQNEELGYNSFGAIIHSDLSAIFNPLTYAERTFIARNGYVPSRRRERYVDPIDQVIRASTPKIDLVSQSLDDSSKPKEIIAQLERTKELENKILLIVGSVGSGKTTFIDHLREVALPTELKETTLWLRLNMNVAPANKEEIFNWVREQLITQCRAAYPNLDFDDIDTIKKLYSVEVNQFNKGVGALYGINSPTYNVKLAEKIEAIQGSLQDTARAYTRFCGTERGKLAITVLDNCDKRTREVQLLMFEVAQWMQKEFRTLVVLPLRDETFDEYRDTPPLDTAIKELVFRIEPPLFQQVLQSRVQLALNQLSKGQKTLSYDLPNGMRVEYGSSELSYYLTGILSSIFQYDKYVRRMLVGLTGKNIRKALEIFVEFCTSGHIQEDEIFKIKHRKGQHWIPLDVVSRVLLRMNRRHYDSDHSYVKNLLAADPVDDRPFYFTRLAIIRWLSKRFNERGPSNQQGYFPVSQIKEELAPLGMSVTTLTREIEYLVKANCITTEDFSTASVSDEMLVKLAPAGFVHLEMMQNTAYLAAVAEDTYFDDEERARRVANRIGSVASQYSDATTIQNAKELLEFISDVRNKLVQLPEAYLENSAFQELTELTSAQSALTSREREIVKGPWLDSHERYVIGSSYGGVVNSIKDNGAFVEFEPGLWGFLPYSQCPMDINKRYFLQLNDKLLVKILEIDRFKHRIALSYVEHLSD